MPRSKRKNRQQRDAAQKERDDNQDTNSAQLPYKISESPGIGKYLEAASDLSAGQHILKDTPIVVGPSQDSDSICIGCYTPLNLNSEISAFRCKSCSFPLCSAKCTGLSKKTGHSKEECLLLSRTPIKDMKINEVTQYYEIITPLRCLILREADPEAWKKLQGMEAHTSIRKNIRDLWNNNQKKVVNIIRHQLKLEEFEEEIIHDVCGFLEVNAFEVGQGLRALYPTAYLFAHDCVPNIRHSDDADFNIFFYTSVPVLKGERLNATYTYILQGSLGRRKHLKDTKFFDCACKRCEDPTELGTNISTLLCPICRHGLVKSSHPLDENADWICTESKCVGYITNSASVKKLLQQLFMELDSIEGNDIPGYERFILKHSDILHGRHYLVLSAMHCLFPLYGKIEGYLITELTEEQLLRKIKICRILLEAFQQLEPGLTKQKGLLYYELQAALMVHLQQNHQKQLLGKLAMKVKLQEIDKCLKESIKMLNIEPVGSAEYEVALVSNESLNSLNVWRKYISQK